MIRFSEIEKFSHAWGVSPETVEKDYCLTWLLLGIAHLNEPMPLVFYGGTAIKKIYIPEYRFSEDLDFIITERSFFDGQKIIEKFRQAFQWTAQKANLNFDINDEMSISTKHRFQCFVNFDGFSELASGAKQIKVDLLYGYDQPIEPHEKMISSVYSDMLAYENATMMVYQLEAILADKFAAVLDTSRNEPRDIYDMWQLLKMEDVDRKQVKESFKKRFGYVPGAGVIRGQLMNGFYKTAWKTRLDHQIVNLPEFEYVCDDIFSLMENF